MGSYFPGWPEGFTWAATISGAWWETARGEVVPTCARCGKPCPKRGGAIVGNDATGAKFFIGSNCLNEFKRDLSTLRLYDSMLDCSLCGGKQWPFTHRYEGACIADPGWEKYVVRSAKDMAKIRRYTTQDSDDFAALFPQATAPKHEDLAMSTTALHPDQLVDAYDEAETARFDHYAICDDQREVIGCSICDRNMDRLRAAEHAMKANPLAMLIHMSEARRQQRHEAARMRSADFCDDEYE